jgi:transcriptional regulator with XRE-family HTH domain
MTQKADAWLKALHERIAKAVKDARGQRSAQQLAEETARLGYPISRSRIANYESGRKLGLDVAELLVLAAALDVPAAALLFPDLPDGDVEILPGQHVSSIAAVLRVTGERDSKPKESLGKLLKLSRERFDKQIRHSVALEFLERLAADKPEEFTADEVLSVADKADEIRELDARITEIPGAVVGGGDA